LRVFVLVDFFSKRW